MIIIRKDLVRSHTFYFQGTEFNVGPDPYRSVSIFFFGFRRPNLITGLSK